MTTEMKKKIEDVLDEKVNELFYDMQTELGISNGDIGFDLTFELDDKQKELADIIVRALEYQVECMKENKDDE